MSDWRAAETAPSWSGSRTEDIVYVLVATTLTPRVMFASRYHDGSWNEDQDEGWSFKDSDVLGWQELPEPPKEKIR